VTLGRTGSRLAAAAIIASAAWAAEAAPARAIVVRRHEASPCTLFVFDAEIYVGCARIADTSPDGELLSAMGSQAISMLRAWRKHNAARLFSSNAEPDSEPGGRGWRDSLLAELGPEIARTVTIDSMAAAVIADSASFSDGDFESRYWIARTVALPNGGTSREIYRARYSESWTRGAVAWELHRMTRLDSGGLPLAEFREAAGDFPTHPPWEDETPEREEKDPGRVIEPHSSRGVIEPSDIPRDLTSGDRVGPFSRSCDESPAGGFVYYEVEPSPVVTVQPVYPPEAGRYDAEVLLHVFVCKTGRVGSIRVARGEPPFCAEAVTAVGRWIFAPATSNGQPVAVWVDVPIEFHR
jgi:TonB family protein